MLRRWDEQGIGTNAILLVGHGTIRGRVLGPTDAQPTAAQLEEMKAFVARAMDEGSFGLSTGLYYAPGSYARTEEVIELAKVAAAKGGVYDTHMRDESSYSIGLLGSIKETIRIGREERRTKFGTDGSFVGRQAIDKAFSPRPLWGPRLHTQRWGCGPAGSRRHTWDMALR